MRIYLSIYLCIYLSVYIYYIICTHELIYIYIYLCIYTWTYVVTCTLFIYIVMNMYHLICLTWFKHDEVYIYIKEEYHNILLSCLWFTLAILRYSQKNICVRELLKRELCWSNIRLLLVYEAARNGRTSVSFWLKDPAEATLFFLKSLLKSQ